MGKNNTLSLRQRISNLKELLQDNEDKNLGFSKGLVERYNKELAGLQEIDRQNRAKDKARREELQSKC